MSYSQSKESLRQFFDRLAPQRDRWIAKNTYYYTELQRLHRWLIERKAEVLDIGCGTGDLLAAVAPRTGVGIDFSHEMVKNAASKYPQFTFRTEDAENLTTKQTFDYIILSNLVGYADDVWQVFRSVRRACDVRTRIVITNYNYWWQPLFSLAEKLGWKMPDRIQNWLPQEFIVHFLYLNGFEVVKKGKYLHIPISIPIISQIMNRVLPHLPLFRELALIEYIVARPLFPNELSPRDVSVSIIIPTHEEAGNIEAVIERMPKIGKSTELVFVDLPGDDGTGRKINSEIRQYRGALTFKHSTQAKKTGKMGALRLGVQIASGEIILIYDADLTVPPEDLEKFYLALIENRGELINGTRLVYPTEKGALRFINHIGNATFATLFSWAFGQHFTDTLCGTKGFWKKDFYAFERTKLDITDLDHYGDFFLLLGAYRQNLKIAEVPVRYKIRSYGDTKLNRFRNGWQFLKLYVLFFWYYTVLKKGFT